MPRKRMEEVTAPHILNIDITGAGGELHAPAALSPQNNSKYTFDKESQWDRQRVSKLWRR